ncbi:MAG: polymerase epsilon subunit [Myxococcaceae bacterium]|nr:polymerase epsilon subunit [Myxococcaceae bacterium]
MRGAQHDVCGCFPTGRHYPGIAEFLIQAFSRVEGLWQPFPANQPWIDLPLAVIDFETTGFDAQLDRVVEIGVVCFERGQVTKRVNWLIQPGMAIPEAAMNVHGITDAMVAEAPRFEHVAEELRQALIGHLPVAYNATFDRKFMHAEMARAAAAGVAAAEHVPATDGGVTWVDPLVWVRELMAEEKSKRLGDICERLGIPLDDAHRAWADAEATGKVLLHLVERMPKTYAELIRIQDQYAAHQEAELADWRKRRS